MISMIQSIEVALDNPSQVLFLKWVVQRWRDLQMVGLSQPASLYRLKTTKSKNNLTTHNLKLKRTNIRRMRRQQPRTKCPSKMCPIKRYKKNLKNGKTRWIQPQLRKMMDKTKVQMDSQNFSSEDRLIRLIHHRAGCLWIKKEFLMTHLKKPNRFHNLTTKDKTF